jgi:hypothetical protein
MLGVSFFHSYAECCCAESRSARTQTLFILISQFDLRLHDISSKTFWPNDIWSKHAVKQETCSPNVDTNDGRHDNQRKTFSTATFSKTIFSITIRECGPQHNHTHNAIMMSVAILQCAFDTNAGKLLF